MPLQPTYHPTSADAAFQLRYSWTGWPSGKRFASQPARLIEETKPLWEQDQLRVLESRWTDEHVQILFSATPDVAPEFVAACAKGRLDHALRVAQIEMPFSRKVAVRSVGDNTRREVEAYIIRQVEKEHFADPGFAARMQALTVQYPQVDLSQPIATARGRYWYALHLVLVVASRHRIGDLSLLAKLRNAFLQIANKKGHGVSRLAVMPDHLHAALRGCPAESPLEIAAAYQKNLAYMTRQSRLWMPGFYVGTFGEYTTSAVRRRAED